MLEVVGSIASIVAAVASIAVFVYFLWDRRHRVRIRMTSNLVEIPPTIPERLMIAVEVVNLGSRPVALDKVLIYGPEERIAFLQDSVVRPNKEKLLTPENPSVIFYGPQDEIAPGTLIAVVAYDRLGRAYFHHVRSTPDRIKRWFRLRFTTRGRKSRAWLVKVGLAGM